MTTEAAAEPSERDKLCVAYHEAGHAVAALYLGLPFERVVIYPDGDRNWAGHCDFEAGPVEDEATVLCAGFAAVSLALPGINPLTGCKSDCRRAYGLLRTAHGKGSEVAHLERMESRAKELLADTLRWASVVLIAAALFDQEHLTGREARWLIGL